MFVPNTTALHSAVTGLDLFGGETYAPEVIIPCAVVSLAPTLQPSSVRADSSNSRGSAQDLVAAARILLPAYILVSEGDKITVHGVNLRVSAKQPRLGVMGNLDHWQIEAMIEKG